jgi:hypothetical protein
MHTVEVMRLRQVGIWASFFPSQIESTTVLLQTKTAHKESFLPSAQRGCIGELTYAQTFWKQGIRATKEASKLFYILSSEI